MKAGSSIRPVELPGLDGWGRIDSLRCGRPAEEAWGKVAQAVAPVLPCMGIGVLKEYVVNSGLAAGLVGFAGRLVYEGLRETGAKPELAQFLLGAAGSAKTPP